MGNQTNQKTDHKTDQKTDHKIPLVTGSFFRNEEDLKAWLEQSQHETDEFYKYY